MSRAMDRAMWLGAIATKWGGGAASTNSCTSHRMLSHGVAPPDSICSSTSDSTSNRQRAELRLAAHQRRQVNGSASMLSFSPPSLLSRARLRSRENKKRTRSRARKHRCQCRLRIPDQTKTPAAEYMGQCCSALCRR